MNRVHKLLLKWPKTQSTLRSSSQLYARACFHCLPALPGNKMTPEQRDTIGEQWPECRMLSTGAKPLSSYDHSALLVRASISAGRDGGRVLWIPAHFQWTFHSTYLYKHKYTQPPCEAFSYAKSGTQADLDSIATHAFLSYLSTRGKYRNNMYVPHVVLLSSHSGYPKKKFWVNLTWWVRTPDIRLRPTISCSCPAPALIHI